MHLTAPLLSSGCLQFIQDEGMVTTLQRKLAPPLVTLLGAEPELQYVVR